MSQLISTTQHITHEAIWQWVRVRVRVRVSETASTSLFTLDFYGTPMQWCAGEGEGEDEVEGFGIGILESLHL